MLLINFVRTLLLVGSLFGLLSFYDTLDWIFAGLLTLVLTLAQTAGDVAENLLIEYFNET